MARKRTVDLETRAKLKRLQRIPHMRGEDELPQVIKELREALDEIDPPLAKRGRASGYDRIARGGRDRSE